MALNYFTWIRFGIWFILGKLTNISTSITLIFNTRILVRGNAENFCIKFLMGIEFMI